MTFNVWSVSSVQLIDLLTAGRKNEATQNRSRLLPVLLFFGFPGLHPVFRGDVLQKRYFTLTGEPLFSDGWHPACNRDIPLFLFPVYRACPDAPGKQQPLS